MQKHLLETFHAAYIPKQIMFSKDTFKLVLIKLTFIYKKSEINPRLLLFRNLVAKVLIKLTFNL